MSQNILKVIPSSPDFIPSRQAVEKVRNLVSSVFPHATNIDFHFNENSKFVDPGTNFHSISCPFCGSIIDLSWWQEAMDQASVDNFSDLTIEVPCCSRPTSLNDLIYDWPAGFARFILTVFDPDGDLCSEDVKKIEDALQCRIKKIAAHY